MTVNLMHTSLDSNGNQDRSAAASRWAQINAIADIEGIVWISEETVNEVARLVEDAHLSNGQMVTAYPCKDEEFSMESYVPGFGPSLLGEDTLRQVRTVLEMDDNGEKAVALFDLIVELGLQISLSGKDHVGPRIKGVNWPADDVEINRTQTNMRRLFAFLGLDEGDDENGSDNIPLDVFEKAVNDNGEFTDMPEHLKRFIACAKRNGSTHVYWA